MENYKDMFSLMFETYVPEAGTTITEEQTIHYHYPDEFSTVIKNIQKGLINLGYPKETVYKYIPKI